MYSSSENSDSDSENSVGLCKSSLNFSNQFLDNETLVILLKKSIKDAEISHKEKFVPPHVPKDPHTVDQANGVIGRRKQNISLLFDPENLSTDGYDDYIEKLYLQNNLLSAIPYEILLFSKLRVLDLSNNNICFLDDCIQYLPTLQCLYMKNNALQDDSIPKDLSSLIHIKEINISGNLFTRLPEQLYSLFSLKYLYAGNNKITEIPLGIKHLQNLQVLHMGGNQLELVPQELSELSRLTALVLCDNRLKRLPRAISQLKRLQSLLIHRNQLCCLPVEIVKLSGLTELSLRDNPLVTKFVNSCARELMYTTPTLKELAARAIRLHDIPYGPDSLPRTLITYLTSGHRCVNPKCKGLYFTSCVEHIKFVDFCGKYRVPLMHYLCSSRCTSRTPAYYNANSDSDDSSPSRIRKVLLPGPC